MTHLEKALQKLKQAAAYPESDDPGDIRNHTEAEALLAYIKDLEETEAIYKGLLQ